MFHEPPKQFLYSAYRVETEHACPCGTTKSGSATAFILEASPKTPWIVTNRHVMDLDYRHPTSKYKDFSLLNFSITGRRPDDSSYTFRLHPEARYFLHSDPENDVVLIEPRIWWDSPKDAEKGFFWHFTLEHLADATLFSGSIWPFDVVCYAGFPDQHDKLGNRPIIRSGRIASDPKFDYSWDRSPHGMCVAYEGFSFSGSSGSPVFAPPRGMQGIPDSRHGYLIGVNAGHVPNYPTGHSGISYFYKSTVILEIIEQHDLQNISHSDQSYSP